MRGVTKQIKPVYDFSPGFSQLNGRWQPYTPYMDASVRVLSAKTGNSGINKILVLFGNSAAIVFVQQGLSGAEMWSVQPANAASTVTSVASTLSPQSDFLTDFSNINSLSWNTESLVDSGNKRFLVQGPIAALKIVGIGACYLIGS